MTAAPHPNHRPTARTTNKDNKNKKRITKSDRQSKTNYQEVTEGAFLIELVGEVRFPRATRRRLSQFARADR